MSTNINVDGALIDAYRVEPAHDDVDSNTADMIDDLPRDTTPPLPTHLLDDRSDF